METIIRQTPDRLERAAKALHGGKGAVASTAALTFVATLVLCETLRLQPAGGRYPDFVFFAFSMACWASWAVSRILVSHLAKASVPVVVMPHAVALILSGNPQTATPSYSPKQKK